ncbi:hypothetical protein O3P69_005400 [Scylla paramamosain]|uniref:Uncharacterized protein n=1 Tax=Scylla paramamosain TaxID=85552 RepID=A0AAW0UDH7_SCYPA
MKEAGVRETRVTGDEGEGDEEFQRPQPPPRATFAAGFAGDAGGRRSPDSAQQGASGGDGWHEGAGEGASVARGEERGRGAIKGTAGAASPLPTPRHTPPPQHPNTTPAPKSSLAVLLVPDGDYQLRDNTRLIAFLIVYVSDWLPAIPPVHVQLGGVQVFFGYSLRRQI